MNVSPVRFVALTTLVVFVTVAAALTGIVPLVAVAFVVPTVLGAPFVFREVKGGSK